MFCIRRRARASCRPRLRKDQAPAGGVRRRRAAPRPENPRPAPRTSPCLRGLGFRAGLRAAPSGAGMRTPCGDSGVATALLRSSAFNTFPRVAFSVLTLRSTGARALRAAPSAAAAVPNARSNDGSSQSGMSPAIAVGVSAPSAAPSRAVSSSVSGESACSEPSLSPPPRPPSCRRRAGRRPARARAGYPPPSARQSSSSASGRHRREFRWRSGRPSRRSGEPCPNRPAPWPPAGGAAGCPRAPRPQP